MPENTAMHPGGAVFACPVCGDPLVHTERVFRCDHGHVFDEAREGYVNLLARSTGGRRIPVTAAT